MGNPAARITDKVAHPLPGVLLPGPGSPTVLIGNLPAWRGLPALAAAALQAAKAVADAVVTAAEAAKTAAMGTPGAPAAIAAEIAVRQATSSAMGALMNGLGAASAAMSGGGTPDTHICMTPLPPPVPHGPGMVIDGSSSVLTNGLPACAVGDNVLEALGPLDPIVMGMMTVHIGKSAGAGGPGSFLDALMAIIDKVVAAVTNLVDVMTDLAGFVAAVVAGVVAELGALIARFGQAIADAARSALQRLAQAVSDIANDPRIFDPGIPPNPGPVFATQDEAARAALNAANPKSIHDNLEYGGAIYRDANGRYGYSGPARGTDAGFNPSSAPAPAGTTTVGDYHTHGDYSTRDPATGRAVRTSDPARDDYNSDNFSQTDRNGIATDGAGTPGYKGYLGTPSGTFRQYDPSTGTTSTL